LWEALRLRNDEITGEHILLAILRSERGHAVWLLGNLGVSTAAVENWLGQLRRQTPAS
jgi:ATP-dependent Clp protease ATP-binding subunit ClpA